eukprot:303066-Hanusia_phi.AAC.2
MGERDSKEEEGGDEGIRGGEREGEGEGEEGSTGLVTMEQEEQAGGASQQLLEALRLQPSSSNFPCWDLKLVCCQILSFLLDCRVQLLLNMAFSTWEVTCIRGAGEGGRFSQLVAGAGAGSDRSVPLPAGAERPTVGAGGLPAGCPRRCSCSILLLLVQGCQDRDGEGGGDCAAEVRARVEGMGGKSAVGRVRGGGSGGS